AAGNWVEGDDVAGQIRRDQAGVFHVVVHDWRQSADLIRAGAGRRADALNGRVADSVVHDRQPVARCGRAGIDGKSQAQRLLAKGYQRIALRDANLIIAGQAEHLYFFDRARDKDVRLGSGTANDARAAVDAEQVVAELRRAVLNEVDAVIAKRALHENRIEARAPIDRIVQQ